MIRQYEIPCNWTLLDFIGCWWSALISDMLVVFANGCPIQAPAFDSVSAYAFTNTAEDSPWVL